MGVSDELVRAMHDLALKADEASVQIEWEPALQTRITPLPDVKFDLTGADAEALDLASERLKDPVETQPGVLVTGRVHLLTKAAPGGPGVVGIEARAPGGIVRHFRVRLEADEYHRALEAHDRDDLVSVRGNLTREANLTWLYQASLVGVTPPAQPWETLPDLE